MKKIITYDNLRNFAYSNDKLINKPIRAIAIDFMGLGGATIFNEDTENGKLFAEEGIIYVIPYSNPWGWMNAQTVKFSDEIIEAIAIHYDLGDDVKVISTGGSMGGLSAIVYTKYAAITPAACVANCPVCDLPYHYTERPDLPRTLYSAFGTYEGTLEEAMESASPIHLAEVMPDVDYCIFHCDADMAVNKQKHSDVFVKKMKDIGRSVKYYEVQGRGHCDLTPEMAQEYTNCIIKAAK